MDEDRDRAEESTGKRQYQYAKKVSSFTLINLLKDPRNSSPFHSSHYMYHFYSRELQQNVRPQTRGAKPSHYVVLTLALPFCSGRAPLSPPGVFRRLSQPWRRNLFSLHSP